MAEIRRRNSPVLFIVIILYFCCGQCSAKIESRAIHGFSANQRDSLEIGTTLSQIQKKSHLKGIDVKRTNEIVEERHLLNVGASIGDIKRPGSSKSKPDLTKGLKVLFIGHSVTRGNGGVQRRLVELDAASPHPIGIVADECTAGGMGLSFHWEKKIAEKKIISNSYDYVVLQHVATINKKMPNSNETVIHHYFALFAKLIHKHGAIPVYYNFAPVNGFFYEKNMVLSNEFGVAFNKEFNAPHVMGHRAIDYMKKNHPEIPMYTDAIHPTPAATYIYACLFYAVLTGRSPVGFPYTMDEMVPIEQARLFQRMVWDMYQKYGDGL